MEILDKLKDVNSLVSSIKNSPLWSDILILINDTDIEYYNWTDLDIIIWYYENHN